MPVKEVSPKLANHQPYTLHDLATDRREPELRTQGKFMTQRTTKWCIAVRARRVFCRELLISAVFILF
jgi:hypothetical protein